MKPKASNDVFLLTLVDFLLQILFFGLLLGVVWIFESKNQALAKEEKLEAGEQQAVIKAKELMGVSNFAEIMDSLTKLAPVSKLSSLAAYVKLVDDQGGIEMVKAKLEKLERIESGYGKPPCLFSMQNGRKTPTVLGTVIADDTTIRFQRTSPELEGVLKLLNKSYSTVETLSLTEFRKTFEPLLRLKPDCFHTLRFIEKTRYVEARDAAQRSFYLNLAK